ncbi:MAG: hypothetical protein ACRDDY_07185 [Clostridium sp.]|uniref:hypothetical protein n=1 Tax=Clostridium sp. TaxID=1506 RepID=UPI003EE4E8A8
MKKINGIILVVVIVVLIASMTIHYVRSVGTFQVTSKNNMVTIDNFERNNKDIIKINLNQIETMEYLPGFIIMSKEKKEYPSKVDFNIVSLSRGMDNVELISLNNKSSGIYIKTSMGAYLISAKTKEETLNLYNNLKEKKEFNKVY